MAAKGFYDLGIPNNDNDTIRVNGVDLVTKDKGVAEPRRMAIIATVVAGVLFCAVIAITFWYLAAPHEVVVLKTESHKLASRPLDNGADYLVKEYVYRDSGSETSTFEFSCLGETHYFNSGKVAVLDDDEAESYVEVETWVLARINPLTGEMFSGILADKSNERIAPTKLYVHEGDILRLEEGAVQERALKQRATVNDGTCLATFYRDHYTFNLEEEGWEYIKGDFAGYPKKGFEVVLLEDADEPARVEGEIQIGEEGGRPSPDSKPVNRFHATFEPTKLYIHEYEIRDTTDLRSDEVTHDEYLETMKQLQEGLQDGRPGSD